MLVEPVVPSEVESRLTSYSVTPVSSVEADQLSVNEVIVTLLPPKPAGTEGDVVSTVIVTDAYALSYSIVFQSYSSAQYCTLCAP